MHGTTLFGAGGGGVAFRISTSGAFAVLHTFTGIADGYQPHAALVQASDGNFYGTTTGVRTATGSTPGTIFKMTPAGAVTVLHTFDSTDGIHLSPGTQVSALIQATDGNFYGTTNGGGAACCGTVFRVTPAGVLTVLHSFAAGTTDGNGANGIMQAADGNFYGTTALGGSANIGTLYRLTPAGGFTLLHSFTGGTLDGDSPSSTLIQATDGNLFGMTKFGGGAALPNGGTVFKTTTAGVVTLLHRFAADGSDGARPTGTFGSILVQAADRNLYGAHVYGGAGGFGVVFRLQIGTGAPGDFDGDGKSDITVFRPSTGTWYIVQSSTGTARGMQWVTAPISRCRGL